MLNFKKVFKRKSPQKKLDTAGFAAKLRKAVRPKLTWGDSWRIRFYRDGKQIRKPCRFNIHSLNLGIYDENEENGIRHAIYVGSDFGDIRIDGIAYYHGRIEFDNSIDCPVYIRVTEEETAEERENAVGKYIEITDGCQFYIGDCLVLFEKI